MNFVLFYKFLINKVNQIEFSLGKDQYIMWCCDSKISSMAKNNFAFFQ